MTQLKIGIIVGSTRPGRNGQKVAQWVWQKAQDRPGAQYDLIDLADFDLPVLDEPVPASMHDYTHHHTKVWSAKIAAYDGFIFVTPEYNHSTSGALKNAIDYLYTEWNNKAAAFVSYGSAGGVRAVEHLRAVASELQLAHVRQSLSFSLYSDFDRMTEFQPAAGHDATAQTMFAQLESWSRAMRSIRSSTGDNVAAPVNETAVTAGR